MKLSAILAVSALAFCGLLAGCGKNTATDNGQQKFIVGFDPEFPPYGFRQNGEYTGFDLDLAKEVCARRGWTFVANPVNWDAKDMELNSGAISCIWNGFTMQGREDSYEWTEPYVDNSQVVLVTIASPIKTLADLAGKAVIVQKDTPVQEALMKGGKLEKLGSTFRLLVSPDYNSAVMELEAGAASAVALDIGVAQKKMADKPGVFRILDEIVMTETYGIGFKKGNVALRDQVQTTLKEMVKDGTAAKISAKWFKGKNVIVLKAE